MTDDYYAKITNRLNNLEIGKRIDIRIEKFPTAKDRFDYLQAVKRYIDEYPQGEYCPIEISNDYQYVKKIKA